MHFSFLFSLLRLGFLLFVFYFLCHFFVVSSFSLRRTQFLIKMKMKMKKTFYFAPLLLLSENYYYAAAQFVHLKSLYESVSYTIPLFLSMVFRSILPTKKRNVELPFSYKCEMRNALCWHTYNELFNLKCTLRARERAFN